jgi:putative Holliday junction resolvase
MYLGVDYGKKRIGLALGEAIPYGAGVLDATKPLDFLLGEIKKICDGNQVSKIIIGMPIGADGSEGKLSTEIRRFADSIISNLNVPVEFEEESFTSSEAEAILKDQGASIEESKSKVDELAAVLILEQFLNKENTTADLIH